MGDIFVSALIGYGLGQLSPAALLSKIKKVDLRKTGTGNLGATNTAIVFGKLSGIVVLLLDVFKAFFAIKFAKMMLPEFAFAGLIAGCFAVIGHIFPLYLNFRGGKGVATLAGMVLAYDIRLVLLLLALAAAIMWLTNTGHYGPISAAVSFPILLLIRVRNFTVFGCVAAVCGLIIYKHKENFSKRKHGEEMTVKEFFTDAQEDMKSEAKRS